MAEIRIRSNSTGKEYEDLSRLYYFGARYMDPELGLFMSPDAAGQYFNPYSYGAGNPINGVDPDGNWFLIDDAIGAVVGAAVGGYIAYKNGYDLTDGEAWAYIGGGAVIGVASVETGGAAAGAFASLGAVGSGVAAGAAAGAVGSFGNYALSSGVETGFSNFDGGGAWKATWTGAAAGAIGGGIGGGLTCLGAGGAYSSFASGFAGGSSGAYLNGARGWDVVKAGAISGGIGLASYGAKVGIQKGIESSFNSASGEFDKMLADENRVASAASEAETKQYDFIRSKGVDPKYAKYVDNDVDAFRHQYWSAKLTASYGRGISRFLTSSHETFSYNTAAQRRMDLGNNHIGRTTSYYNAPSNQIYPMILNNMNSGNWVDINGNVFGTRQPYKY